jgi:hypothetical protein
MESTRERGQLVIIGGAEDKEGEIVKSCESLFAVLGELKLKLPC